MDSATILTIVVSLISTAAVGYVLYLAFSKRLDEIQRGRDNSQDTLIVNLNQRVDNLTRNVGENLQMVTDTLLKQLNETTKQVDTRLHTNNEGWMKSSNEIRNSMENNARTIRDVTAKLAQMEEAHKRIFEVGKDISSLQEILRAPKLRGSLGELFLGDLLGQIFPASRYQMQYTFKSGETVDAVLLLRDSLMVSIDSKFPLESFKRMIDASDDSARKVAKKEFLNSIKKRIDEIASKYILPDEKTLDFALMYIPAENVYYEMIIKGDGEFDVLSYAYSKKVIPVSPNNLYVYLQTVALGLRGMQIEERAKEILADLSRLNTDFTKVSDSYDVLGKHLTNAVAKYEDTNRLLGKFGAKVEQIESKTVVETQSIQESASTQTSIDINSLSE
ncbi:DNA recombination protein RmuC [candidate division WWE3 bacterium]|nr:DNA recombination protein RmuC [candidate division WWE3 bacterium]